MFLILMVLSFRLQELVASKASAVSALRLGIFVFICTLVETVFQITIT
jgi:hypothetical protein